MNHTSYTRNQFPLLQECLDVTSSLRKRFPLWISSAFSYAELGRTKVSIYLQVEKKKKGRKGYPKPDIFILDRHIFSIIEAITGKSIPDAISNPESDFREAMESFLDLNPVCFPFCFEGIFTKPVEEMLVRKGLQILKDKGINLNEGLPGF